MVVTHSRAHHHHGPGERPPKILLPGYQPSLGLAQGTTYLVKIVPFVLDYLPHEDSLAL